ncbi:hypothetical protein HY484_00660 [Candidatus Woesearchaeota archaeon]|nr:hypothetical protein [Candidatus Woesearchaeota archaeon]
MGRQLDYLVKCVYEGADLETLKEDYKPFDMENVKDTIFHLLAKNCAGKPSIKLAKELREFKCAKPESAEFLKKFIRNNRTVQELGKYSLTKDVRTGIALSEKDNNDKELDSSYTFGNDIKYAGQFAFCILYKGRLAGYATFSPGEKKIAVEQIQGIKKHVNEYNPLKPLWWSVALLSRIVDFAKENNVPEVEVLSVKNNKLAIMTFETFKQNGLYLPLATLEDAARMSAEEEQEIREKARKCPTICYGNIHLMPHQGFLLYDITAKRLGFQKAENGNYVMRTA